MKVLRIIARLNVGGPARHVALLDAGLRARGHQTLLVHGSLDEGEASLEGFAEEHAVPLRYEPRLGRRVSGGSDVRALMALLRLIFEQQPDVVHTHTAKAGTLGRVAAFAYNATRRRSKRALVVHTFHGHVFEGYFSPTVSRMVRAIERVLARGTDVVVTISPRQREDIVERYAVTPSERTVVVPLGLDLDSLLAIEPDQTGNLRADIGATADDIVVGYVGRMVPVKDLPTLIRAFARAQAVVSSLRLVLAGDGSERSQVESLAETLGVRGRVHLRGWVDDLPPFYASIDLLALSSINEGTPVAVIEAMAAGRAVVATAVGGVPDVVAGGVTGLLVPAASVDALADAIQRLATDRALRESMGAAGRARARERYSHLRLVDDVERLYEKELGKKRGAGHGGQR